MSRPYIDQRYMFILLLILICLNDDNGYNEHALVLDELFDVISMFDACVCLGHLLIFGKHVFLLALICLGMLEYDLKHVWMMIIA